MTFETLSNEAERHFVEMCAECNGPWKIYLWFDGEAIIERDFIVKMPISEKSKQILYKCCLSGQIFSVGCTTQRKQHRQNHQLCTAIHRANGSIAEATSSVEPELHKRLVENQTMSFVEFGSNMSEEVAKKCENNLQGYVNAFRSEKLVTHIFFPILFENSPNNIL